MFKALGEGLLDLFFPPACILCKTPLHLSEKKEQLCLRCRNKIIFNRPPFCRRCSRPLSQAEPGLCPVCRHNKHHFDRAWAAFIYTAALRELVHHFKYNNKTVLRYFFTSSVKNFFEHYQIDLQGHDLIIPVPLHSSRQRERGYNQAQLLAQMLAQHFRMPLCLRHLRRTRATPAQSLLSPKERWTNLKHAFKISHPLVVKNKNILLIDDLLTTGATTSEAAAVLKSAGAKKITVLTLAITK